MYVELLPSSRFMVKTEIQHNKFQLNKSNQKLMHCHCCHETK